MGNYYNSSDLYIKETVYPDYIDLLYTPCHNLSCMLSDYDGKLYSSISSEILRNLTLTAPGIIVQGKVIVDSSIYDEGYVLPQEQYTPEVCFKSYQTYKELLLSGGKYVHVGLATSPLLAYSKNLPTPMRIALYACYLDMYSVYKSMIEYTGDVLDVSSMDIMKLTNNLRWLSYQVECLDTNLFDFTETLRDSMQTLMYIHSMSQLFSKTYSSRVSDFQTTADWGDTL